MPGRPPSPPPSRPTPRRARPPHAGPAGSRETFGLPDDVSLDIDHVAHFGKAAEVKQALAAAVAALDEGHLEAALAAAMPAKEAAPRAASVREVLGLAYYGLERWREAVRELAAYRRLSGRRDEDHIAADCERALGRPERALEILQGLKASDVSEEAYVEALVVAAAALYELDRSDEAPDVLRRGPIDPPEVGEHHLRLWYAMAEALERAGRADAREWWDAVYAEDPDFFDVAERRLKMRPRR